MAKKALDVPTPSVGEIAKKWKLNIPTVKKAMRSGEGVEKEHTTDTKKAAEIARDHLGERPDYYKKLDKMEKSPIKKESAEMDIEENVLSKSRPNYPGRWRAAPPGTIAGDKAKYRQLRKDQKAREKAKKEAEEKESDKKIEKIEEAMHLHLKKNALHHDLGIPEGEKIPQDRLQDALHSNSKKLRKRAQFAVNASHWHHGGKKKLDELTTKFLKNYTKAAHKKWDEMSDEERNSRKGKHMVKGVDVANRHISKGGHIREEEQMNDKVKGLIRESIDNVQAKKLTKLQENINAAIALKVANRLEEAKADIAKTYFAK